MSLRNRWRDLLGSSRSARQLGRLEAVQSLVPPSATYVTAGLWTVVRDGQVGGLAVEGRYRYDVGPAPHGPAEPMPAGLLVLTPDRLCVVDEQGVRWSVHPSEVTALDAHRHTGFAVLTRGPEDLLVSHQTRVRTTGPHMRTAPRISNAVSGWDAALASHGVTVRW